MRPWQEYCDQSSWHDAANIFPLMPDDELRSLADDIKTNGLKNAITLLDDKVLDGRNRLLACKLVDVRPTIEPRNPEKLGSPVSWVLSQNLHRRQLTASQRAVIGMEAEKLFAVEAEQRMLAGKKIDPMAIVPQGTKGLARDQAAKESGASPRYIQEAKAIAAKAPELIADVGTGKFTIPEAKKIQQLKTTNPKLYEAVRTGKVAVREAKPTPTKKDLRARYSEPEFFARVGRMMAATLVKHPLLDELLALQKQNWTPEAEHGFKCIIKNVDEIAERAHVYANGLNKIVRAYKKARVAA